MNSGANAVGILGSRLYFQRDPVDIENDGVLVPQPWFRLGIMSEPAKMKMNPSVVKLKDSQDGMPLRFITQDATDIEEEWDCACENVNMHNMAVLFLAKPPVELGQVGGTAGNFVGVEHVVAPGGLVKLYTAAGNPAIHLASGSIVVKLDNTAQTPLTEGTDWELEDDQALEHGAIRIIAGGAITEPTTVLISWQTAALAGLRLIEPQSQGIIEGKGVILMTERKSRQKWIREGRMSLMADGLDMAANNYAKITFKAMMLNDLTAARPAGTLIQSLGALPLAS